ncbi:trp repressor-binding protein WrbA [Paenibacillus sp. J31TS4]|uniref:NAD(P)H:quinone oxidoreductase n=1 Tax=Paenibacillus sp. J31TS4 TaxID=2807195 RepID=UPI001B28E202|nr:NAD(P)H:quinone oxidoreductase [Paenibacillus sp. J31TS4]GIP41431.1 trp repressor-binding protein WrbA [Paenibacillus sp. J31TS4]
MTALKTAIIYYSSTGTNYQLAREAEQAALDTGAETRLRRVKELAPREAIAANPAWLAHYDETAGVVPEAGLEDLDWADVLIFSCPTRYGSIAAQMKQFLDITGPLWSKGKLANKVVTAMTSAQNPHGGQEATILSLYTTMFHWGALVVTPGYTDQAVFEAGGNPYGTSATAAGDGEVEAPILKAARHQTNRALAVAGWLQQGRDAANGS